MSSGTMTRHQPPGAVIRHSSRIAAASSSMCSRTGEQITPSKLASGGAGEVGGGQVEVQGDAGLVEIGGDVAQMTEPAQPAAQRPLRRQVQERADVAQQLRALLEQQ